jgi:hypothetical protein
MPRKSSVTQYEEPRTYWAFEQTTPSVFPVTVVAESEHCLWLKPAQEFNRAGRPYQPVQRQKRALCTFHSFHEAKHELLEAVASHARSARKSVEQLDALFARAAALEPPQEEAGQ